LLAAKFQDARSKTVVYDPQLSYRRIDKAIKNAPASACIMYRTSSSLAIQLPRIITAGRTKTKKKKEKKEKNGEIN